MNTNIVISYTNWHPDGGRKRQAGSERDTDRQREWEGDGETMLSECECIAHTPCWQI